MDSGDVIAGRFTLEHKIGEGGLGVVWQARETGQPRPVALKLLKGVAGQKQRRRFEVEARVLSRLRHRNCVVVRDFGQLSDGTPFIAMELLDGHDLSQFRGQRMPIEDVVAIAREVAEALRYAHDQGVAHRDLKPENIFITASGGLKLLDFGLAKLHGEGPAITKTGECLGTPAYLSPEQARDLRHAGPASDQYSLGVVMYELIAGRLPFEADSPIQLCMAHLSSPPPPITRADCPPALKAIVQRLLAKEAHARFGDCGVLIRALDNVGTSVPAEPGKELARTEPRRGVRRLVFPAVAAVVSLSVLLLLFGGDEHTDRAPPPPRDVSAIVGTGAGSNEHVEEPVVASRDLSMTHDAATDVPDLPAGQAKLPAYEPRAVRATAGCGGERPAATQVRLPLDVAGQQREIWVQFPDGYDANRPHPAIFALTYRRRDARAYLERGGISDAALRAGYVVVGLEAIDPDFEPARAPFEALKPTESLAPPHVAPWEEPGDIEFAFQSVELVGQHACIDQNRIFATGHTEGARLLRQMTCEAREFPFAAIALTGFAARPREECTPRHTVPTLRVSGMDDTFIPHSGGVGCEGDRYHSSARTDVLWSRAHDCSEEAAKVWVVDDRCRVWSCQKAPYVSCSVAGGHYLQHSHYNDPAMAGLTKVAIDGLGDRKSEWFDPPDCAGSKALALNFEQTILPLFQHYASEPPE